MLHPSAFVLSTLGRGVRVLLPLLLLGWLATGVLPALLALLHPVAAALGPTGLVETPLQKNVAAGALLLLGCLALGLLLRVPFMRRAENWVATRLLRRIPLYKPLRRLVSAFTGRGIGGEAGPPPFRPCLLTDGDGVSALGYVVEDEGGPLLSVLLPEAPMAFSGAVVAAPRERVRVLDVPLVDAVAVVTGWGDGLADLLAADARRRAEAGRSAAGAVGTALALLLAVALAASPAQAEPPALPAPAPAPAPAPGAVAREVQVPLRDGTRLAATLLLAPGSERRPVVVVQTPYDKTHLAREVGGEPSEAARGSLYAWERLDRRAYAWLVVDWRGFHASRAAGLRGSARGWRRGQDGYDVVEWAAAQPWCNGRVGLWGASALGKQQLDTAAEQPPHLVCAVPLIASMGTRYTSFYEGGVLLEAHTRTLDALGFGVGARVRESPLPGAPAWAWAERLTVRPEAIDVPCLFVSGWWDNAPQEVLRTFEDVVARGGPRARAGSLLMLGPWTHTAVDLREQGDRTFPAAEGASTALTQRFLDAHLRGLDTGLSTVPRVSAFQAGEERWRGAARWADLVGAPEVWHLHADGRLAPAPPAPSTGLRPARTYRYDPRQPVPTLGGRNLPPLPSGPRDLRALEARSDVLRFASDPLPAPLALCGSVEAALTVSADRPDVDVALLLADAHPDGRVLLVGETIQRASLRDGRARALLRPGESVPLRLRLPPCACTLAAGHRLVLLVTSGGAPRWERNPHSGAPAWDEAGARDVTVRLALGPGEAALTLPRLGAGGAPAAPAPLSPR